MKVVDFDNNCETRLQTPYLRKAVLIIKITLITRFYGRASTSSPARESKCAQL